MAKKPKVNFQQLAALMLSVILAALLATIANRQWDIYTDMKNNEAQIKYHEHKGVTDGPAR